MATRVVATFIAIWIAANLLQVYTSDVSEEEFKDCTSNEDCKSHNPKWTCDPNSGICICNDLTVRQPDSSEVGKCLPIIKSKDETCQHDIQCAKYFGYSRSSCKNERCVCNDEFQFSDYNNGGLVETDKNFKLCKRICLIDEDCKEQSEESEMFCLEAGSESKRKVCQMRRSESESTSKLNGDITSQESSSPGSRSGTDEGKQTQDQGCLRVAIAGGIVGSIVGMLITYFIYCKMEFWAPFRKQRPADQKAKALNTEDEASQKLQGTVEKRRK